MNGWNDGQLISIVAMLGWLVLVLGAYRSHNIDASKTIRLALTWAAIFGGIAILFGLLM